jgi:hypothetical protein
MNAGQFVAEFRAQMDDAAAGYLWRDEEIIGYLNSAVDEACERALLLEDRTSDACCLIDVEPGEASYPLHASVIQVKRLALGGRPLEHTSEEALDRQCPGWESRTGTPRAFFIVGERQLRLVPTPTTAATLTLTVYRKPLKAVPLDNFDTAKIELPEIYHARLMPWIYRCALIKPDSETVQRGKALEHEAVFERSFGARPDANLQRKRRDRRPPIVRMQW